MSAWQSELERLTRPSDLTHTQLESSRIRSNQRQNQHQHHHQHQPTMPPATGHTISSSLSDTQPGHLVAAPVTCERCLSRPASFYLPDRDELLCARCESAHAGGDSPSRVAAGGVAAYRLSCSESVHGGGSTSHAAASVVPSRNSPTRATFYCRACARAVCATCASPSGAHGHAPHACLRLEDELHSQLAVLRRAIGERALDQRKQARLDDLQSLDAAGASLASTLNSLVASEQQLAQGVLHRLDDAAEVAQVRIDQVSTSSLSQLQEIDQFLEITGMQPSGQQHQQNGAPASSSSSAAAAAGVVTPAAMCTFLVHLREWLPRAHQLGSGALPANATTATTAGDSTSGGSSPSLPRESSTRASQLAQFPQLLALLRVKDELLRFAMAARKGLLKEQEQHAHTLHQLYAASQAEMHEWMQLSERLAREVRTHKQRCCFCQVPLSGHAASTPCQANMQTRGAGPGHPIEGSTDRREGDGMHFFA